jgi:hypothetical protein
MVGNEVVRNREICVLAAGTVANLNGIPCTCPIRPLVREATTSMGNIDQNSRDLGWRFRIINNSFGALSTHTSPHTFPTIELSTSILSALFFGHTLITKTFTLKL